MFSRAKLQQIFISTKKYSNIFKCAYLHICIPIYTDGCVLAVGINNIHDEKERKYKNIRIYKYSDMPECIDINIRIFRYTTYKYIHILIYKYIDIQIFYYKKEINKVSVPKVRTSEKEKMFVKFAPEDNKGCTKCS